MGKPGERNRNLAPRSILIGFTDDVLTISTGNLLQTRPVFTATGLIYLLVELIGVAT